MKSKSKSGGLTFASSFDDPYMGFALMAGEVERSKNERRDYERRLLSGAQKKKKAKYITTVNVQVLWQGMHDFVIRVFPKRLSAGEIAKLIDKEAVSFKFKVKCGQRVITPFDKSYFLGGKPIKGKGKIKTRHNSYTFFDKGDIVLKGF